jgi:signal transduction histidine kinase
MTGEMDTRGELERLISVASHDLREPLRAINGFAALLERESADAMSDRGREFLTLIQQAGQRMDELLDGLNAYGRAGRERPEPRDVDLSETVDEVLDRLRDDIAARGALVTRDELGVARTDPASVQQVLEQLIANALKFNEGPEPHVHVAAGSLDDSLELTVLDDGIGIPERERDRVFEMFRRLHPRDAYPGSGVGLAICKRVVDRHGGRIWIDDAPHGGSAVHVVLPHAQATA